MRLGEAQVLALEAVGEPGRVVFGAIEDEFTAGLHAENLACPPTGLRASITRNGLITVTLDGTTVWQTVLSYKYQILDDLKIDSGGTVTVLGANTLSRTPRKE